MTHFSILRENHWHCSKLNPNRATFEYNYSVSKGILCFCSGVRQQTRVAANTAIAAQDGFNPRGASS